VEPGEGNSSMDTSSIVKPKTNVVSMSILVLLLFIRLIVRQVLDQVNPDLSFPIYLLSSYLLIGVFLTINRGHLSQFFIRFKGTRQAAIEGLVLWIVLGVAAGIAEAYVLLGHISWGSPILVVMAILNGFLTAAIIEEVIFRGILLGYLHQWTVQAIPAILIQGTLFASGHVRYLVAFDAKNLFLFGVVSLSGLLFGWQALRHKTILGTILTHALSNATIFLFIGGSLTKL
jgi:membrane protease YdiL (CAAX protease family)